MKCFATIKDFCEYYDKATIFQKLLAKDGCFIWDNSELELGYIKRTEIFEECLVLMCHPYSWCSFEKHGILVRFGKVIATFVTGDVLGSSGCGLEDFAVAQNLTQSDKKRIKVLFNYIRG